MTLQLEFSGTLSMPRRNLRPRTPSHKSKSSFEPLMGSPEAAKLLGDIHVKTLQRYARRGSLPGYQIGGHWYFRASELDAQLEPCGRSSARWRNENRSTSETSPDRWRVGYSAPGLEYAGTIPSARRLGVRQPEDEWQAALLARNTTEVLCAARLRSG
jgi:excisionase family DNA binding protein